MFCVIEGIDGAGKTHLARRLGDHPTLTVVLKDDLPVAGSWVDRRLWQMHGLTWSYDPAEPVWRYSRQYWLHSLLAWFWLFYEARLAELAAQPGAVVVTDGWYLKHQARFRQSGDDQLATLADDLFTQLPQPDVVVFLDTAVPDAARQLGEAIKPSEAGAFDEPSVLGSGEGFGTYQARTRVALLELLDAHPARVLKAAPPINVTDLAQQIEAMR